MQPNNAGGYAFQVDYFERALRFLVLGSDNGTYYVAERDLTQQNIDNLRACLAKDGQRLVDMIVEVSTAGRAPKADPAIFALALAASDKEHEATRRAALAALPKVCRIPTHLFAFIHYAQHFRGWGRALRRAVADWYTRYNPRDLAYHVAKYGNRYGFTHADALRLSHPKTAVDDLNAVFKWALGKADSAAFRGTDLELLAAYDELRGYAVDSENVPAVVTLIRKQRLTHDMIPGDWKRLPEIWDALLPDMPIGAMIRNLATMTANGLLTDESKATQFVVERLTDGERLRKARVHPLAVLAAMHVYAQGHGERGNLTWTPVDAINKALDQAFYRSFGNVTPTGKRLLLALDVSGSMFGSRVAGLSNISAASATGAMAMVAARSERDFDVVAFAGARHPAAGIVPMPLNPQARLEDVMETIRMTGQLMSATDCALPMLWAMEKRRNYDAFIVYTDSETWFGKTHPVQALDQYRRQFVKDARLVVVGMTATDVTIADPADPLSLNVVGFDAAAPEFLSSFIRGKGQSAIDGDMKSS